MTGMIHVKTHATNRGSPHAPIVRINSGGDLSTVVYVAPTSEGSLNDGHFQPVDLAVV